MISPDQSILVLHSGPVRVTGNQSSSLPVVEVSILLHVLCVGYQ